MPIFNQSDLVSNAINSIRNQTMQDWELIIISDGSDDIVKLEQVLEKFNDKRIGLIKIDRAGLVVARNAGNFVAKADVIAMQDADDLSMPDRLEKCLKEIKNGADIVYHGLYTNMWDIKFNCIGREYIAGQPFNKWKLLQGQYIPGACVFRKNCWEKKPFRLETQYAFDYMMHLDWAFSGFKYKVINEGLYEYVRHANSASIEFERSGQRQQSFEEIKKIMKSEYNQEVKLCTP